MDQNIIQKFKMAKPFFSIILCTHNRANMVNIAIESVIKQTFKEWELIIVNDASKDNTTEVISKYLSEPNIKYIENAENKGNYESRNIGLNNTSGKYITVLDDDDELPIDTLQLRYDKLKEDDFPDMLHTNTILKYSYEGKWNYRPWYANPNLTYTSCWHNKQSDDYCQIVGATLTIKKEVFDNIGNWNSRDFPTNGSDIEFTLRLLKSNPKISFLNKETYIYVFHADQITKKTSLNEGKQIISKIKAIHPLEDEPNINIKDNIKGESIIEPIEIRGHGKGEGVEIEESINKSEKTYDIKDQNHPDNKKNYDLTILNIHPLYDCAAAGMLLSQNINEFTRHRCYHIVGEKTFLNHNYHLFVDDDLERIKELVKEADIIHLNKYFWSANKNLQFIEKYAKDKKIVFHLHGNLDIWKPKTHFGNIHKTIDQYNMEVVSCNPITEKLIDCIWLPNPVPTHHPEYLPTYKNWNSPLKLIHSVISDYNKGTNDLKHVIKYLKENVGVSIDEEIINRNKTLNETLLIKKKCHTCVDNITQGFIGMAGWEAMSQQLSCISRLDPYVKKRYKELLSPEDDLPIIDVNGIDEMAIEIVKLSEDVDYRYKTALYSRRWMEKNYHPQKIANIWGKFYEDVMKKPKKKKKKEDK